MSGKIPAKIVLREYLESLIVAVLVALFLRLFVISAYKIPTGSMVPTLKAGDFIFAYKLPYGVPVPFSPGTRLGAQPPKRGDVVVFRHPEDETLNYVKRVVALPGERVEIRRKHLYINDKESKYVPLGREPIEDIPGGDDYNVFEETFARSTHLVINRNDDEAGFFGPVIVPPGHVFVLGDNRDTSDDSRYWGTVPIRNIEGRVLMIWLSLDWMKRWGNDRFPSMRWERIFQLVD